MYCKTIFILLVLILTTSCGKHHETEKIVDNILTSDINTIDKVMEENRPNTSYYLDSVLFDTKAKNYFKGTFEYFNRDYYIVPSSANKYKFYEIKNNNPNSIIISVRFHDEKYHNVSFDFYFNFEDSIWELKEIDLIKMHGSE